jgi:hypothetical protein
MDGSVIGNGVLPPRGPRGVGCQSSPTIVRRHPNNPLTPSPKASRECRSGACQCQLACPIRRTNCSCRTMTSMSFHVRRRAEVDEMRLAHTAPEQDWIGGLRLAGEPSDADARPLCHLELRVSGEDRAVCGSQAAAAEKASVWLNPPRAFMVAARRTRASISVEPRTGTPPGRMPAQTSAPASSAAAAPDVLPRMYATAPRPTRVIHGSPPRRMSPTFSQPGSPPRNASTACASRTTRSAILPLSFEGPLVPQGVGRPAGRLPVAAAELVDRK